MNIPDFVLVFVIKEYLFIIRENWAYWRLVKDNRGEADVEIKVYKKKVKEARFPNQDDDEEEGKDDGEKKGMEPPTAPPKKI